VSCIAGALTAAETLAKLAAAGFAGADVAPTGADLNVYKEASGASCCGSKEPAVPSCCAPKTEPEPKPASSCCGGAAAAQDESAAGVTANGFHDQLAQTLEALDLNDYAMAVQIFAVKP
jgi:hypothetical protein